MAEKNKLSNRFKLEKNRKIEKRSIATESVKLKFVEEKIKTIKLADEAVKFADEAVKFAEISNIEQDFKLALIEKIEAIPVWFEYTQNRQKELIKSFVENKINVDKIQLTSIDKDILIDNLFLSISDFGAVQYLLDNEKVSTVIINGTKSVHIIIDGKILNTETKLTDKQLNFLTSTLKNISGIDNFENIRTFKKGNYSIKVIGSNICETGTNIIIDKIVDYDKKYIVKSGMMTAEIFDFIVSAINQKKNIVISGGINSGKTVLTEVLLKAAYGEKRTFLLENNEQIYTDFDNLVKFQTDKNNSEYKNIVSEIQKIMPDFIVTDLNYVEPEFSVMNGYLSTMRANTVEFALKNLISMFMVDGTPEKFAKTKALTEFDYIIQLNRTSDGVIKLTSIVELQPAKTMQASVKTIAKLSDGQYITQIPQPITSMRAEALISKNRKMTSRFNSML